MPLHLVTASRLVPLLEHLADTLRSVPLPPREMETIVVQSQGMRRWLTLQLADAFGCAGSLALPFPASFVRELGNRISNDRLARDERDPFSREVLTWRVEALLRTLPGNETSFEPLRSYLAGGDERTRFGLAAQVAARLDDYQMFRADFLADWEQGGDAPGGQHASWQAALWRALVAESSDEAPQMGTRLQRAISALQHAPPESLPSRVTVFGVSTLPPLFVDLLVALSRHAPVTVYSASLAPDTAHPVASAFGAQSREFIDALVRRGASHTALKVDSRGNGVLQAMQAELADGAAGSDPIELRADDESLRVHDAHGELRQLEVVRDQLLAALSDDPTLRPHDLLLLVPDAAEWAPMVDAVFGVSGDEVARIPYRIADRPMWRTEPAADAMARLLALEGGRFERHDVLDLLSHPLVRQGAGLSDGDLELLELLLQRANVRWGYDAGTRVSLGLPAYDDATWRAGLDRLLLGVATGRRDDQVLGLLPEAGDTAGEGETIALLASWVDDLAEMLGSWRTPRALSDWTVALQQAVDRFLVAEGGDEQQQVQAVTATIRRLSTIGTAAGHSELVPFAVVRDWMEQQLDDDGFGGGFLVGGMTVAALKPMRSLPFRVIAVAGLDDGDFPRRERRAAFDLLERERRAGDRDLRSDDRQLFLDLLLAAGDRLILAYSGRAVSDNSPRAPSVVLDELLDHLDRRSGGMARPSLLVAHPLQPFSPAYFAPDRDARLFTYSRAQARAAQASARSEGSERPFVADGDCLDTSHPGARFELTARDLADCWMNPSRFFCRRVLRFSLRANEGAEGDDEIFAPDKMEQGSIRARMLANALTGDRYIESEQRRLLADGALPPYELGRAWHEVLDKDVAIVLREVPLETPAISIPYEIEGEGWRLTGRADGVRGGARFVVRAGAVRAEHWIRAWVEHVAMCAAHECGNAGLPTTTVVIGRSDRKAMREVLLPIADASAELTKLVEAARDGHAAPLPFFPQSAWSWLEVTNPRPAKPKKSKKGGAVEPSRTAADPRDAVRRAYHTEATRFNPGGDCDDPYIKLCFRGSDPTVERWDEFELLTRTLFTAWRWAREDS